MYEWRGVLAGAYLTDAAMRKMVAHVVEIGADGYAVGDKTLCGRLEIDRMSDMQDNNSRRCPGCERKMKKLNTVVRS